MPYLSRPAVASLTRALGTTLLLAVAPACRAAPSTETPAVSDVAPECEAYASEYERCLGTSAPNADVAREVAENARDALRQAAKDPAMTERMNEKCRAARAQLSTTCQ